LLGLRLRRPSKHQDVRETAGLRFFFASNILDYLLSRVACREAKTPVVAGSPFHYLSLRGSFKGKHDLVQRLKVFHPVQ
jgi:hypothetical protein